MSEEKLIIAHKQMFDHFGERSVMKGAEVEPCGGRAVGRPITEETSDEDSW